MKFEKNIYFRKERQAAELRRELDSWIFRKNKGSKVKTYDKFTQTNQPRVVDKFTETTESVFKNDNKYTISRSNGGSRRRSNERRDVSRERSRRDERRTSRDDHSRRHSERDSKSSRKRSRSPRDHETTRKDCSKRHKYDDRASSSKNQKEADLREKILKRQTLENSKTDEIRRSSRSCEEPKERKTHDADVLTINLSDSEMEFTELEKKDAQVVKSPKKTTSKTVTKSPKDESDDLILSSESSEGELATVSQTSNEKSETLQLIDHFIGTMSQSGTKETCKRLKRLSKALNESTEVEKVTNENETEILEEVELMRQSQDNLSSNVQDNVLKPLKATSSKVTACDVAANGDSFSTVEDVKKVEALCLLELREQKPAEVISSEFKDKKVWKGSLKKVVSSEKLHTSPVKRGNSQKLTSVKKPKQEDLNQDESELPESIASATVLPSLPLLSEGCNKTVDDSSKKNITWKKSKVSEESTKERKSSKAFKSAEYQTQVSETAMKVKEMPIKSKQFLEDSLLQASEEKSEEFSESLTPQVSFSPPTETSTPKYYDNDLSRKDHEQKDSTNKALTSKAAKPKASTSKASPTKFQEPSLESVSTTSKDKKELLKSVKTERLQKSPLKCKSSSKALKEPMEDESLPSTSSQVVEKSIEKQSPCKEEKTSKLPNKETDVSKEYSQARSFEKILEPAESTEVALVEPSSFVANDSLDSTSKENSLNKSQINLKEFKTKRRSYTKEVLEDGVVMITISRKKKKVKS